MDATEQFGELVTRPDGEIPLGLAALSIAAHDHTVDEASVLTRLDELAQPAPVNAAALAQQLFGSGKFLGNQDNYSDVRNSFLDVVIDRGLGIPITLSILMMEVGRRSGIELVGIGMPGHFLVGDSAGNFYDPFSGGRVLDVEGVKQKFAAVRGGAQFSSEYLAPVSTRAILARVLANLIAAYLAVGSAPSVLWVVRLRLLIPGLSVSERVEAAGMLSDLGRFSEAAAVLENLAEEVSVVEADRLTQRAHSYRARGN